MAVSIHDRISLLTKTTKQEQKIIDYINNAAQSDIVYQSITEFADKCGVGDATVLRFCRKLGLKGYGEFRLVIAQNESLTENTSDEGFAVTTMNNMINAIKSTYDFLDPVQLEKAVNLIIQAKNTYVFGSGNSSVAALELRNKMLKVGVHASHIFDDHFQAIATSTLGEGDLLILFSVSGSTKNMIKLAEMAKAQKVNLIIITNYLTSKLAKFANALLYIVVKEAPLDGGSLITKASQLYIISLISNLLYIKLGDTAKDNIEKTADAVLEKAI